MLRDWTANYQFISGDAQYYFWWLSNFSNPVGQLREYPVPAVWFLNLFSWPAAGNQSIYITSFAIGMAGLDILFAVLLWRAGGHAACWYWVLFGFLMGPIMWFRFDMLSALLVGLAFLWVDRRPGIGGALIGAGAAIKLWPALLMLPLAHRDAAARRRTIGFALTGGGLALVSLATTNFARLISPLTWQSDRGLQIESIAATPLMLARAFGPDAHKWPIEMSSYNAYEVFGPGVGTLLALSSVLMVVTVAVACVLCWLAWHDRQPRADSLTLAGVAILALLIAANKTLSPQYMLWLGAPLAVLLHHTTSGTLPPGVRATRRLHAVALAALGLVIAALTQYVFPNHYQEINRTVMHHPVPTVMLALRNVLTLILGLTAAWWSMQQLRTRRIQASATATTTADAAGPPSLSVPAPLADDSLPASEADRSPEEVGATESVNPDELFDQEEFDDKGDQESEDGEWTDDWEEGEWDDGEWADGWDEDEDELAEPDESSPQVQPRRLLLAPLILGRRAAPEPPDDSDAEQAEAE